MNLIWDIYSQNISESIGNDRALFLRVGWTSKIPHGNSKSTIFGGVMTRYTLLENANWINKVKKEFQSVAIPDNVFPNVFETEYIFIPEAHRLFVKVSAKIPPVAVLKFLKSALPKVGSQKFNYIVSVMAAKDKFDEIFAAASLDLLKINISYTNDDLGKKAKRDMDRMFKRAHVGQVDNILRPDATGSIDTNSPFVQGMLGLAVENGSAEATFHDKNGKRKKIKTANHPEKMIIKSSDPDNVHWSLFDYVMNRWRKTNAKKV